MAPHCVFGQIPHFTGTENGRPYGGSSLDGELFSPLERIEWFSMHFNGLFNFALQRFRSTAISLERINVIKRDTIVPGLFQRWDRGSKVEQYIDAQPRLLLGR